mgnify:CR=1 FL=1
MEGMVLVCLATAALSMIGLVIVCGCMVIAGVDIIQEKIVKRFFPKKYYYDWDEEI